MNQSRGVPPSPRAPTMARPQPAAPSAARPATSRPAPQSPQQPQPQRTVNYEGVLDVVILGGFDGWKGRMKSAEFDMLFMNLLAGQAVVIATPLSVASGPDAHRNDSFYILHPGAVLLRATTPNPGEKTAMSTVYLAEELLEKMTASAAKQG